MLVLALQRRHGEGQLPMDMIDLCVLAYMRGANKRAFKLLVSNIISLGCSRETMDLGFRSGWSLSFLTAWQLFGRSETLSCGLAELAQGHHALARRHATRTRTRTLTSVVEKRSFFAANAFCAS